MNMLSVVAGGKKVYINLDKISTISVEEDETEGLDLLIIRIEGKKVVYLLEDKEVMVINNQLEMLFK